MPNWCENRLYIEGDREEISKLKELAEFKEGEFWFSKIVPIPKSLLEVNRDDERTPDAIQNIKLHGYPNWYEWCMANWGCRSLPDNDVHVISDCKDSLSLSFLTAWNPPLNLIEEVSKKFPNLSFALHYAEPTNQFGGSAYSKDGDFEHSEWEDFDIFYPNYFGEDSF